MGYDCILHDQLYVEDSDDECSSDDDTTGVIYVGDIEAIGEEPTNQFNTVVSVCQDKADENVGCTYKQFPLADDRTSVENWGGTIDYSTFREACDYVRYKAEPPILVHCHSGQNRSVAVVTAVLAVAHRLAFDEACDNVRLCRDVANSNDLMKSHARRYITELSE